MTIQLLDFDVLHPKLEFETLIKEYTKTFSEIRRSRVKEVYFIDLTYYVVLSSLSFGNVYYYKCVHSRLHPDGSRRTSEILYPVSSFCLSCQETEGHHNGPTPISSEV